MKRTLLVEDDAAIRDEVRRLLVRAGHEVAEAGTVDKAVTDHDLSSFNLVIAEHCLPDQPGTALIRHCRETPVLIIAGFATLRSAVKSAVEAMKQGAADFISKPFDPDKLLLAVERLVREGRMACQDALRNDDERSCSVAGIVGDSPPMRRVFERIRKVAPTSATVLILGKSGTGKELVARAVHEQSDRRDAPFVAVNCASIPDGLIESELFGHEKGAFTGAVSAHAGLMEAAHGGTLFLDEIGELPAPAQARLLRALQDNEVRRVGSTQARRLDVRLLAATHRDLQALVREGRFRADLYFRLRVLEIRLPALCERAQDIPQLATFLLEKACRKLDRPALKLSPKTLQALRAHSFPGNVRELENALQRAVILCEGDTITPDLLALTGAEHQPREEPEPSTSMVDYFKRFVLEHQNAVSETKLARALGITRQALWYRRIRFNLPRPR